MGGNAAFLTFLLISITTTYRKGVNQFVVKFYFINGL